jgi:hypothetical protein
MSSIKRSREDGVVDEAAQEQEAKTSRVEVGDREKKDDDPLREAAAAGIAEEEEEDDRINLPTSSSRSNVKKGKECPYLDTISRQVNL